MSVGGGREDQLELFGAPPVAVTVEDQLRIFGPANLDRFTTSELIDIAFRTANALHVEPRQHIVNELARRDIPATDREATFRVRDWFVRLAQHVDVACRSTALPEVDPAEVNAAVRPLLGVIAAGLASDADPTVRSTVIDRFLEPVRVRCWVEGASPANLPAWTSALELARILEVLVAYRYEDVMEGAKIGSAITTFAEALSVVGALDRIVWALAARPEHHRVVAGLLGEWVNHLTDETSHKVLARLDANRDPEFLPIWEVCHPVVLSQMAARTARDAGASAEAVLELDGVGEGDPDEDGEGGTGLCRRGADLARRKLVGADFTGVDLTNADFRGSNLRGALFYRATLAGALFDRADLTGATLAGANLQGASFFATDASLASFIGADLRGANLTAGRFRGVNFQDADLRSTRIDALDVYGAHLAGSSRDEGFPTSC